MFENFLNKKKQESPKIEKYINPNTQETIVRGDPSDQETYNLLKYFGTLKPSEIDEQIKEKVAKGELIPFSEN